MKREGRQHQIVRTHAIVPDPWNPRSGPCSYANKLLDSPTTASLFVGVSPRPTNRFKFTGKCGRVRSSDCRIHPVGKAKDKAKGTQKQRSRDVVVCNYRLATWQAADGWPSFKFSGFSATGILEHLAAADCMDYEYDYDDYDVCEESSGSDHFQSGLFVDLDFPSPSVQIEALDYGDLDGGDDVDDDAMSFCEVGFVWEQVEGDEGWCVLEEM